jgi:hypothetical protein
MAAQPRSGEVSFKQGLQIYHDPVNATVEWVDISKSYTWKLIATSIIAVHGLGCEPEASWQSETGDKFNWIKGIDGLKKDFPDARIMLYAYASAWKGPFKVKQYVHNVARTLLESIHGASEVGGWTVYPDRRPGC